MKQNKRWSDDIIKELNDYQKNGMTHPYTCNRGFDECETNIEPRDFSKDGVLIATKNGWICPCGKYTQDWYHDDSTSFKDFQEKLLGDIMKNDQDLGLYEK